MPRPGDLRGDVLRLKEKFAGLGISELRRLRLLEDENGRLKRPVADLTLDKHILNEVIRKGSEAVTPQGTGSPTQAFKSAYGTGA